MAKPRTPPPMLPLADFERIFRTIHGVLLNEDCNPAHSCLFFGIIGAELLNAHHGKEARPVAGFAAFNLGGPKNNVLAFANGISEDPRSTDTAFHCWVEVGGWLLDFTSPLYPEMLTSSDQPRECGRKMFQRVLTGAEESLVDVSLGEGAFFVKANPELTQELIAGFMAKHPYVDLRDICVQWYRRTPRKMIEPIGIANKTGVTKPVRLSPIRLEGAWTQALTANKRDGVAG